MKIREQVKQVDQALDISNNKFVNALSEALMEKIALICPELKLVPSGRSSQKGQVSLVLNGQAVSANLDETKAAIEAYMNKIKNDKELLNLLE